MRSPASWWARAACSRSSRAGVARTDGLEPWTSGAVVGGQVDAEGNDVAVHLLWVTARVELDQAPIDEPKAAVAIEDAREAADRDPAPIRCEE